LHDFDDFFFKGNLATYKQQQLFIGEKTLVNMYYILIERYRDITQDP